MMGSVGMSSSSVRSCNACNGVFNPLTSNSNSFCNVDRKSVEYLYMSPLSVEFEVVWCDRWPANKSKVSSSKLVIILILPIRNPGNKYKCDPEKVIWGESSQSSEQLQKEMGTRGHRRES